MGPAAPLLRGGDRLEHPIVRPARRRDLSPASRRRHCGQAAAL